MQGLFNPVSILFHMLNTAILFVALYFLLYKPVNRYLDARRQGILKEMDDASALRAQADLALSESRARLDAANVEAAAKAAKVHEQAQGHAREIVAAANREADRIIENAQKEAEELAASNRQAVRDFAATLAVDITTKILSREITGEDQSRLIDEFLEGVK